MAGLFCVVETIAKQALVGPLMRHKANPLWPRRQAPTYQAQQDAIASTLPSASKRLPFLCLRDLTDTNAYCTSSCRVS